MIFLKIPKCTVATTGNSLPINVARHKPCIRGDIIKVLSHGKDMSFSKDVQILVVVLSAFISVSLALSASE